MKQNLSSANRITEEQIRAKAYEIYRASGGQSEHALDHWLQAEYELKQLPIRKLAESEPAEAKMWRPQSALVSLVQVALILAGTTQL